MTAQPSDPQTHPTGNRSQRRPQRPLRTWLAAGLAAAACTWATPVWAQEQTVALLEAPTAVAAGAVASTAMAGTARSARVNPAALHGARLRLPLPDGREWVAERQREQRGARGELAWVGQVMGVAGSVVSVTMHRGHLSGFVHAGDQTWEIRAEGPGRSQLFRVDTDQLPGEPPVPTAPLSSTPQDLPAVSASAADPAVHDLLIVYTPAAATAYGGAAGLESMAISAVAAANQAYANSQINITLNLVGLEQVAYAEDGNISTSLSRLRDTSDGHMDGVHQRRNDLGADLVALLSTDTGACGVGYLLSSTNGNSAYGFSVTVPNCLSNHTLAHELGHNQGNHHDRANGGTPLYPYAFGYRTCDHPALANGQNFRTVMGYSCTGVPRVNHFSNPNVLYGGVAQMGIAHEVSPTTSADNARSMNLTAAAVAAYRNTPAATLPAAPTGLAGSAPSSSTINLSWVDNASTETGFTLERTTGGGAYSVRATLAANTTSFGDTGLTANTAYTYRLRAFNGVGSSGYSNVLTLTTPAAPTVPAAPSPASVSANGTIATLTWANVASETGYEVVREVLKRGAWTATSFTVGADVTQLVQSLASGTYRYRVRAVNASGASAQVAATCSSTDTGCNADGSITITRPKGGK